MIGLSITSRASTTWSTILRLISLVVFHVDCDECSYGVLPRWNSTIPSDRIA